MSSLRFLFPSAPHEVVGSHRPEDAELHTSLPAVAQVLDYPLQFASLARVDQEGDVNGIQLVRRVPDEAGLAVILHGGQQ